MSDSLKPRPTRSKPRLSATPFSHPSTRSSCTNSSQVPVKPPIQDYKASYPSSGREKRKLEGGYRSRCILYRLVTVLIRIKSVVSSFCVVVICNQQSNSSNLPFGDSTSGSSSSSSSAGWSLRPAFSIASFFTSQHRHTAILTESYLTVLFLVFLGPRGMIKDSGSSSGSTSASRAFSSSVETPFPLSAVTGADLQKLESVEA